MKKEIKIVLKDANDPEWQQHPFDVFVDGEIIPRIKRFALDFKYFEPNQKEFDAECFKYTVEQFLNVCEPAKPNVGGLIKNEDIPKLFDSYISPGEYLMNKKDVENLYSYITDKERSEILGTEASRKCYSKKLAYSNADTEDEATDIFHDAIKTGEAKLVKEYTVMPPYLPTAIRYNISSLKDMGFDIAYDSDANKLTVKNMEHLAELNGDSIAETKKIRKEAEDLITETTNMVKSIDDLRNNND